MIQRGNRQRASYSSLNLSPNQLAIITTQAYRTPSTVAFNSGLNSYPLNERYIMAASIIKDAMTPTGRIDALKFITH